MTAKQIRACSTDIAQKLRKREDAENNNRAAWNDIYRKLTRLIWSRAESELIQAQWGGEQSWRKWVGIETNPVQVIVSRPQAHSDNIEPKRSLSD